MTRFAAAVESLRPQIHAEEFAGLPVADPAPLYLPPSVLAGRLTIPDAVRDLGLSVRAGSGSGKSALLGRVVCLESLLRFEPQIILDPVGALANYLLLAVALLPLAVRRRLWPRLLLVNMSASERVTSFPLLARQANESLRDVADRFLNTLRKLDPHLQGASIQGWNRLVYVGRPLLMVLAALQEPVSRAADLLRAPEAWETRLIEAQRRLPEVGPAVDFLRNEILNLKGHQRMELARPLLVKLAPFALDPGMAAMFCSRAPGLDLAEIVRERRTVILDFRHETNAERRAFKIRWIFEWFMAYVKARGEGRHMPLGFVIDELSELTNQRVLGEDLFGRDLEEAVSIYFRNARIRAVLANQELHQLPTTTQNALLALGTQVMGRTAHMENAKRMAEQFFALDPYRVKHVDYVAAGLGIDSRITYLPLEEQILLGAQALLELKSFEFLVQPHNTRRLVRVSTKRFMGDRWPSDEPQAIAYIRRQLLMRSGMPSGKPEASEMLPTWRYTLDTIGASIHDAATDAVPTATHIDDAPDNEDWTTVPPWS